ncbi:hypothetical protein P7C71_g849, partial [Lecanoromycetidae sp. Uapishka_2]
MSVPQIPPRPARASQQQQLPTTTAADVPQIPPRPERRRAADRSQSPSRELYARSPLNEPPLGMTLGNKSGGLYGSHSQNASSSNLDLPQRPPSVSLPSIGQEGNEYADMVYNSDDPSAENAGNSNEPKETRNIDSDLPLHAPKPSLSNSTAKRRVSQVTRTDSTQAAAVGIGKAPPPADDKDAHERILKPKVSFRTVSSASTERPGSSQTDTEDDHGIPEIGQRVPMYPDAGDVQAPSPSPFQQNFPAGIGFHNSGSHRPGRHHRRTPSGREILPPGSYGMHGHGVASTDQFEKSWYEKHPEQLEKEEHGEYGPGIGGGRGEWALSSDDLNKLVRETSKSGPNTPGLPNEQIGYMAYEGNGPSSAGFQKPLHSNHSQPHVESPLRKASFPVDAETGYGLEKKQSHTSSRFSSENALESETEDDEAQLAPPRTAKGKLHGSGFDRLREEFGRHGDSLEGEDHHGVPILASDEVARTPVTEFQQPAVSPLQSRRGSGYYAGVEQDATYPGGHRIGSRSGSASNSRPTSRPASVHSLQGLSRFSAHDEDRENMHTPLEDVDEYEPLFPDEDGKKTRQSVTAADRLKLREQMKRFPSKDIWEDTPDSLQLQASVETPEPANEQPDPMLKASAAVFETPEQESARKGEVDEDEKAKLIPREERLAKSRFKPHLREEISSRPGLAQRFPSRDIWEDSPDSAYLETTVGDMPIKDPKSPPDEGLEAGAVVKTSGAPIEGVISGGQSRDNATVGAAAMKPSVPPRPSKSKVAPPTNMAPPPSVPARPAKRLHQVPPADAQVPIAPSKLSETTPTEAMQPSPTESRTVPLLPERKPQIPARPAKAVGGESSENVPLAKITSASSVGSDGSNEQDFKTPPAPKPKPAVPARPAGNKIAALKGGFLADLDSRLKLGPQAPKPQDKEHEAMEDKAPLTDARKGRAKGPTRRKPVAAPADTMAAQAATERENGKSSARNWSIRTPWTVFEHDGVLKVGHFAPINVPRSDSTAPNNVDSPHDESSSAPTSNATTSNDKIDVVQRQASMIQTDGATEDAKDMQQAQQAVQESLTSNNPLSQEKVASFSADSPGLAEEAQPPFSKKPSPTPSPASTVISPTTTNTQSQTGVKDIVVNPGTETEEKMTAIVGGEAQRSEHGSDAIVQKD